MEATGDSVRDSNKQEVRHDHYVVHWSEHVDDDDGSLPAKGDLHESFGLPQYDFHSYIQYRVPHESVCFALSLFYGTVELIRSSCCYIINFGTGAQ